MYLSFPNIGATPACLTWRRLIAFFVQAQSEGYRRMIDLHVHSTFSDGSLRPTQLAEEAAKAGLHAVALTDHDTVDGIPEFLGACERMGVLGIPGIELSIDVPRGTLHMLGYWIDLPHAELEQILRHLRTAREERNRQIMERLYALGCNLTWEDVKAFAGEEVVGRLHFAQALEAKGYVKSKDEAFERFLGKGKSAYVNRYRLSVEQSLRIIRAAGGVAALAHPFTLELSPSALRAAVAEWKNYGLSAIEVFYSEHTPEQERQYLALSKELDLVAIGGSDFHGAANPAIRIGRGFGSLVVPDEIVDCLRARRPVAA